MQEKVRILLVDDDPDFIDAVTIFLEAGGYSVSTPSNGLASLSFTGEEAPDIVVLDLMIGNADTGFSVARRIQAEPSKSAVPIIMLSSLTQSTGYTFKPEEHPDYFPVDVFLEKPVSPETLLASITEITSSSQ